MNLDTRARRAADGVRDTAQGVDPMTQMAALKREDKSRRRNAGALAAVGALALVAGTGWFTGSQLSGNDRPPADSVSEPSPTASPLTLEPGPTVGTALRPRLVARAPESWFVMTDDDHMVWLDNNRTKDHMVWPETDPTIDGAIIYIVGPIVDVIEPGTRVASEIPLDGYADWLREHPLLTVVSDSTVTVDGRHVPQLTIRADDNPVLLDVQGGNEETPMYSEVPVGAVLIETVIEVDGSTMVVRAISTQDADDQAELHAALDLVLSTMRLPS